MTTIINKTAFYLKIFEETNYPRTANAGPVFGPSAGTIQPYSSANIMTEDAKGYMVTLAIDRNFQLKDFPGNTSSLEVDTTDLRSLDRIAGVDTQGTLDWSGNNIALYPIDTKGQISATPATSDGDTFDSIDSRSIYALMYDDGSGAQYNSAASAIGFFATMLPTTEKCYKYDNSTLNIADPSGLADNGLKIQSWFIPCCSYGQTDSDGTHTMIVGDESRISPDGKDLKLFTEEVVIYQYKNFNKGHDGAYFWIIKGDCANLDAFSQTIPDTVKMTEHQSVKVGPGTMLSLYDQKNQGGKLQEIFSDAAEIKFSVKSWKTEFLASPASAGLEIYTEIGQHISKNDCVHRITVVGNGFVSNRSDIPDEQHKLKPGKPKTLYISTDSPDTCEVNIDGQAATLPVASDKSFYVPFNILGHVQITITPNDNSLVTPNLFFRTDKMPEDVFVMADPNEYTHKRLAAAKFDLGKINDTHNIPSLDLKGARSVLGVDSNVHDDDWDKVADITKKINQAVVHSRHKDAAGMHTRIHIDGANMSGFQDFHVSFKNDNGAAIAFSQEKNPYQKLAEDWRTNNPGKQIKEWNSNTNNSSLPDFGWSLKDLWNSATHIAATIGQAVEHGVENAVHVLAELEGQLYHLTLDATTHIAGMLKAIYKAVKVALTAIIKFIRFLLSLLEGGIQHTCEAVQKTLTNGMDYCADIIGEGTDAMEKDINDLLKNITGKATVSVSSVEQAKNSHQVAAIEKMMWIMNLITQGITPNEAVPPDHDSDIDAIKGDMLGFFKGAITDSGDLMKDFVRNPHRPSEAFHEFAVTMAGDLQQHTADMVNHSFTMLSSFVKHDFKDTAEAELSDFPGISFFDSMLKEITGMDKCSPLCITSALIGVPLTFMYGAIEGKAPATEAGQEFWNKSQSSMETFGDAESNRTKINHCLGILVDAMSAFTSVKTITAAKGKATASDKSWNLLVGGVKTCVCTIQGVLLWDVWTDWAKSGKTFAKACVTFSFFRGAWGFLTATKFKINGVAVINCMVDAFAGFLKIVSGILIYTEALPVKSQKEAYALIQLAEGAGLVCELGGLIQEESELDLIFYGGAAGGPLIAAGAHVYLLIKE